MIIFTPLTAVLLLFYFLNYFLLSFFFFKKKGTLDSFIFHNTVAGFFIITIFLYFLILYKDQLFSIIDNSCEWL